MGESGLQRQRQLTLAVTAQFLRTLAHELFERPAGHAAGFLQLAQDARALIRAPACALRSLHTATSLRGEIGIAGEELLDQGERETRAVIGLVFLGAIIDALEELRDHGRVGQTTRHHRGAEFAFGAIDFHAGATFMDFLTMLALHAGDLTLKLELDSFEPPGNCRLPRFRIKLLLRTRGSLWYRRLIRKLWELNSFDRSSVDRWRSYIRRRRTEIGHGKFEGIPPLRPLRVRLPLRALRAARHGLPVLAPPLLENDLPYISRGAEDIR
ncbi:MAG: hypothetical protein ACXIVD_17130 [Salinarimonas sp.]